MIVEGGDFYDNLQPFNGVFSSGENGNSSNNTNTADNVPGPTALFYRNTIHDFGANGGAQGGPLPSSFANGFYLGRGTYTLVNNLVWGRRTSLGLGLAALDNAVAGESVTAYHNGFTHGVDVNNSGNQTYSGIAPSFDFDCNWHTEAYNGPTGGSIPASAGDFNNTTSNSGHLPVVGGGLEDSCPTPAHATDICGNARVAPDEAGPFTLATAACCLTPAGLALLQQASNTCGLQTISAQQLVGCQDFGPGASVTSGGGVTVTMGLSSIDINVTGPGTWEFDDGC